MREVFYQFKNWIIVFAVVLIAVLMILVPVNLTNTFEAPEFVTYMGSSLEDIQIEVEDGENLETNYEKVIQILRDDTSILQFYEYQRIRVQTLNTENKLINLNIECGDHAGNGLQYLSGKAPEGEKEIALSYLNANAAGKKSGDTIGLYYDGKEQQYIISGIYQDVTAGGYTAKSKHDFSSVPADKYSFSVNLKDNKRVEEKAKQWSESFGAGVTADPMQELMNQTLGGVVKQLKLIVFVIALIGACLVMLITALFLKLRLAKDLSEIAVLKAVGFSERDMKLQYLIKIGFVSISGIFAGILLTAAAGDKIISAALSIAGLGIKQVELITDPVTEYILCPLLLLALILIVTRIV
jgi:putative ABC transport system permease protein